MIIARENSLTGNVSRHLFLNETYLNVIGFHVLQGSKLWFSRDEEIRIALILKYRTYWNILCFPLKLEKPGLLLLPKIN